MQTQPEPQTPPNQQSSSPETNGKRYFVKKLVSMPFFVAGKRVPFESLAQNTGAIVLDPANPDQAAQIVALDAAADANRSGIVRLASEQEWLDLKKKRTPQLSLSEQRRKQQKLRVLPTVRQNKQPQNPSAKAGAAGVAGAESNKQSPEVGGTGSGDNGGVGQPAGTAAPPFVPTTEKRSAKSRKAPEPKPEE